MANNIELDQSSEENIKVFCRFRFVTSRVSLYFEIFVDPSTILRMLKVVMRTVNFPRMGEM
jgi:hypothetical protein